MKDDSFAEVVKREGIAPPPDSGSDSDSDSAFCEKRFRGAAILPPDCGDDALFSECTLYAANGTDTRRLKKELLRTEPESVLDLHGMTAAEAHSALEDFLRTQLARGRRNVEIIHGRGGHSADGRAILREKTRKWLAGCRAVLGFAEPPRNSGAVRVLLRRGE